MVAQTLYAIGAALCIIGSLWNVAFIFAVQLNYAIAPRLFGRRREAAAAASDLRNLYDPAGTGAVARRAAREAKSSGAQM